MHPLIKSDECRSIPFVVYYRLEPKKRAYRVNYVCFGGLLDQDLPSAIRYIAPIGKECCDGTKVAVGALEFYIAFMKRVLIRKESPKFSMKKIGSTVVFRLKTKGLCYYRALFFLTWFRYVHHYPEIIHRLYIGRNQRESLESTFRRFFLLHNDYASGKFIVSSNAAANEMVMYNWGGKKEPITLNKLWSNMERASKPDMEMGVQECFR